MMCMTSLFFHQPVELTTASPYQVRTSLRTLMYPTRQHRVLTMDRLIAVVCASGKDSLATGLVCFLFVFVWFFQRLDDGCRKRERDGEPACSRD